MQLLIIFHRSCTFEGLVWSAFMFLITFTNSSIYILCSISTLFSSLLEPFFVFSQPSPDALTFPSIVCVAIDGIAQTGQISASGEQFWTALEIGKRGLQNWQEGKKAEWPSRGCPRGVELGIA